jgi:multidrug efflux pump subunit AcrA (membrane-fusion protein)
MDQSSFEQRERERRAREQQKLGQGFERGPVDPEGRALGDEFSQAESIDGPRLGDTFADATYADERRLGNAFADPNSNDDAKLGKSFVETQSSRKKKHEFHVADKLKPRGNHTFLLWFLLGVVVLFGLIFILGFLPRHERDKQNAQRAEAQKDKVPAVEVVTIKREQGGSGLTIPGTTTPLIEAFVYARSNGYLKRRLVDIGDHVHKGQLLAVIDAPDLDQQVDQAREQVRQAEAQVAQQQTQLALTKITWDRWRVLVAKGVFARQDGDQREADYLQQQANVAAAERNVQAYQANLRRVIALQEYEQVRAPFDGVITARNVDVGSLISAAGSTSGGPAGPSQAGASAGQQGSALTNSSGSSGTAPTASTPAGGGDNGSSAGALFSIAQVQRLRILVSVPEGYADAVHPGQHALLHFQEFPKQDFYGDVTRTAGSIDQNTRTLLTEVQVDNHKGILMAGMYAVVTFAEVPQNTGGPVTVPGDAIVIRDNLPMVALVANGKVHLQRIEIGRDFGSAVEVVNGLKPGDVIATSVTDEVTEGASVQTRPSPAEDQNANQAPAQTLAPPGGSSQYGDQSITDQNMQGQANQKKTGGKKDSNGPKGSGSKP